MKSVCIQRTFSCPYFRTFKKEDHFGKTLIKLHWLNHPSSALSKVMCFSDKKAKYTPSYIAQDWLKSERNNEVKCRCKMSITKYCKCE